MQMIVRTSLKKRHRPHLLVMTKTNLNHLLVRQKTKVKSYTRNVKYRQRYPTKRLRPSLKFRACAMQNLPKLPLESIAPSELQKCHHKSFQEIKIPDKNVRASTK